MPDLREMLPDWALEPLHRLGEDGVPVYAVGGTVRDWLLGRGTQDVDLASPWPPDRMFPAFERAFGRAGAREAALGAIRFDGPDRGDLVCTSFREEADYGPDRRPRTIHFVDSLRVDAKRRDFRVNAIYCRWPGGDLEDPTGGGEDLETKTLRIVGDPAERLTEDPLRSLRAIRFASSLGFDFEAATAAALRAQMFRVAGLSPERVRGELFPVLASESTRPSAFGWLHRLGAMTALDPLLGEALARIESVWSDVDRANHDGHGADPADESVHTVDSGRPSDRALQPGSRALGEFVCRVLADEVADASTPAEAAHRWEPLRDALQSAVGLSRAEVQELAALVELLALHRLEPLRLDVSAAADRDLLRGRFDLRWIAPLRTWLGDEAGRRIETRAGRIGSLDRLVQVRDLRELGLSPGPGLGQGLVQMRLECLKRGLNTRAAALAYLRSGDAEARIRRIRAGRGG